MNYAKNGSSTFPPDISPEIDENSVAKSKLD